MNQENNNSIKFSSMNLSEPVLKAVAEKGYDTMTPIQAKAIPAVLNGSDVMAAAQTGTGKTAAFTLPILERLIKNHVQVQPKEARVLILTPTRELAAQVAESVATYGKNLRIRSAVVFGGVKINPQINKLREGVDVLVATPGRLLDLYNQRAIRFTQLSIFVLDEADRMLDMGFIRDITKIIHALPKKRQNLMFSATFSGDILRLAKQLVQNPVEISVSPPNKTADTVDQWVYPVDRDKKSQLLIELITQNRWDQVLVFTKTKHGANKLTKLLNKAGLEADAIHGNKSQGARTRALANFKDNKVRVLVATDIAARGLDINQLPHVVNYDLPNVPEDYVHRIGRTGRAGKEGQAVSLVSSEDIYLLFDIERVIKQLLPRKIIEGFKPSRMLPESNLERRSFKPKKFGSGKKPFQGGQRPRSNSYDQQRQGSGESKNRNNKGPKRYKR